MNTRNLFAGAVGALLFLFLMFALLAPGNHQATAAPMAAVTPVAGVVHSGVRSDVLTFWNTEVITEDGCSVLLNTQDHAKVDLHWVIDQGGPSNNNTTTLTTRWTNTGNIANIVTDATVVNANASDATAGGQFALFGRQNCIYADVTNSRAVTVTIIGVAK